MHADYPRNGTQLARNARHIGWVGALTVLLLLVFGLLQSGCWACGLRWAGYAVHVRVIDAEAGTPVGMAHVDVVLESDDGEVESLPDRVYDTDSNGEAVISYSTAFREDCFFVPFVPPNPVVVDLPPTPVKAHLTIAVDGVTHERTVDVTEQMLDDNTGSYTRHVYLGEIAIPVEEG